MAFKIGDSIIMMVDSGKGRVWKNLADGEYRGKITNILPELIEVTILGLDPPIMYFPFDGIAYPCTGMSIRLAEEKVEPTPSQWIEGKAPSVGERKGNIFIWADCYEEPRIYSSIERLPDYYTHWQYVQLPPPPPAKEVEAYGYLEFCNKHIENWQDYSQEDINKVNKARRFYSQPATAENLEKYINGTGRKGDANITLDAWISYYQKSWQKEIIERFEYKIFFTPAALDELGIK